MGSLKVMAEISLGFKHIKGEDTESLFMYTYIYKSGWLFVEAVSFNIDGEIYEFNSIKENREVISSSYVQEYNSYDVDLVFLEKLSNGIDIKIRISGTEYYIDPEYDMDNNNLIKEYIQIIK